MMKKIRLFILTLTLLVGSLAALAQDIIVNVAPVQRVLPPQVLLYVADPGKYFTIQLMNTSAEAQQVHLGLQIEQVMPQGDLSITTPPRRQPLQPFTVPANGQITLTPTEMKHLFDHIPASEISAPANLFNNYSNGSFGLLPEGQYQIHVTAYRWRHPQPTQPIVVSSPTGGSCMFTVCYSAQPPFFLMPMTLGTKEVDVAEIDPFNAMFTWAQPVLACDARSMRYEYDFRVVEIPQGWSIDQALDHGPVIYQRKGLLVPQCIIPQNIITSQFYANKRYVAQVTASSSSSNPLDFTLITNNGKSDPRMFRIKTSDEDTPASTGDQGESKDEQGQDEEEEDIKIWMGGVTGRDSLNEDSLYTFRNPRLTQPYFASNEGARKVFETSNIAVKWDRVFFLGGEGLQSDTIEFEYEVQLFVDNESDTPDRMETLKREPIFKHRTKELEDSILWKDIQEKVKVPSYLVLRVKPIVVKGSSVAFTNDSINTIDFAMAKRLGRAFFQCSNTVDITNEKPTEKSKKDLIGKTVAIGEYELTIDKISSGSPTYGFTGEGRVKWEPLGTTVMVCVKFEKLKINTDDVVFSGECVTYSEATASSIETVDKLFSDWGIDHLIGDTGIPYAKYLESSATNAVKDIAKKIDIAKYYKYCKAGNALKGLVTKGKIDQLYMPVQLPKEINSSPVDIQITKMKFAPTHATMDVIGEFTLPNTSYTKNDILIFGAPRLCISPERVLPEAGTIALLSDFSIKDPKSSYEMTFKAPKNVLTPEDGCFIAWKEDKLELLGIDLDMKIPNLVKDVNGTATKEKPVFNVSMKIADWDNWIADKVTIDPFQVEGLPGWTFKAEDIVYDHSTVLNSPAMGKFPMKYDKAKADISNDENAWQGLYIKTIGVQFPTSLKMGDKGKERLELDVTDMFVDKSGCTLDLGADKVLTAKTGSVGGWSFTLDKVGLSFIQNDFNDCHFSGKFSVPLLSGDVAYSCQVLKQTSNTGNAGQFAYVFKTQQVDDLSLDFMLAKADFEENQSYFLVEAVPTASGMDTKCELLLGGKITLGGTDYLNKRIKDSSLPLKFEIPGVHFCGMRLANCSNTWTSKYEAELQNAAKNAKLDGISLYNGKEIVLASNKIYFHTGKWSLASDKKFLGPFDFNLTKYDFSYEADPKDGKKKLKTTLKGEITLVSGISLTAGAGLSIYSNVNLPKDLTNIGGISLDYDRTQFDEASFSTKFADMEISGSLTAANDKDKEGYSGDLTFKMPGNLFYITANGGYYKNKSGNNFTYGWFYAETGGKAGIPIDPLKIHRLQAGFYYNCSKNDKSATPNEGVIGVVAGLGLSTSAGESLIKGEFDMTVVYDRANDRLSTMIMSGKLSAVEDLVKAEANVVYQNTDKDQFLKIDVTVDATADSEKVTQSVAGKLQSAGIGDLKAQLNGAYKKLTKVVPMDGLKGKTDDEKSKSVAATKAPKKGENLSASAGATINVEFMVTMKKDGKQLNKAKWHVYLGEPDIAKRCTYTYLKINSSILKVDIGANGYVCIGNELPNGGVLPEIPDKIRSFLNGSTSEKGLESASLSKATSAREQAIREFNEQAASNGGGVMFGGQIYGYFDVDLGIFYMDAGATAGFDVSLIKLGGSGFCTNLNGQAGWKGWYGYGQLYAYLYAKFGIRIDMGFWSKDFDVVDAGVGGVFRMQGPKPTHFDGEARVKLKLLGGLIDINRKYRFSAGDECDMFAGNALDEFRLFGDLTIGSESQEQGWAEKNQIAPKLLSRPCFYTEAPLKEPFRVLDPTELARLKKNYSGDVANLEAEASRTFIFRSNAESKVTLKEYKSKTDKNPKTRTFYLKGQSRFANFIDISELEPNRFYAMTVTGYAKEIQKGVEVDPVTYNEKTNKYVNKAWSQSKTYYFCTGPSKEIDDIPDLQEYIAIAYPSMRNNINSGGSYIETHDSDMKRPNFALTADISKKAFQKGKLIWRLSPLGENTKVCCERDNEWVVTANTCNMRPVADITGYNYGKEYKLQLVYQKSKTVYMLQAQTKSSTMTLDKGALIQPKVQYANTNNTASKTATAVQLQASTVKAAPLVSNEPVAKVETEETVVAEMIVRPHNTHWKTGYKSSTDDSYRSLSYEKPFVGCRIDNYTMANAYPMLKGGGFATDYNLATQGGILTCDPYFYIAALSNYVFIGGWQFAADRLDVNITTAQSLIYTDKGGVYEGKLGGNAQNYNCLRDLSKIQGLSIYSWLQYEAITPYPLPNVEGYGYTLPGLPRANSYVPAPDSKRYVQVSGYIDDMYRVYPLCERISNTIRDICKTMDVYDGQGKDFKSRVNLIQAWYSAHRGQYASEVAQSARLQIPYYQFPILYGSCLENNKTSKKITAWGTIKDYQSQCKSYAEARGQENNSEVVFSLMLGKDYMRGGYCNLKSEGLTTKRSRAAFVNNENTRKQMKSAKFTIYRVNAYDYNNCRYLVDPWEGENKTQTTNKEQFTINYPLTYYGKK